MKRSDPYFFSYIDQYESSIKKSQSELSEIDSILAKDYYESHGVYYPLIEKGYSIDYLLDLPRAEFTLLQMKIVEVEEARQEALEKSLASR